MMILAIIVLLFRFWTPSTPLIFVFFVILLVGTTN
jgi:hypothetical protein